jgi:hypothetical protein
MARQGCASSVDPIKRGLSPLSLARANSLPVPSLSFSYTQVAVLFRNPSRDNGDKSPSSWKSQAVRRSAPTATNFPPPRPRRPDTSTLAH